MLRFDRVYSMFYIRCRNTACAGAVKRSCSRFLSGIQDGLPHGIGIESMRHTVANCGGRCEFSVEDGGFSVLIAIFCK